MTAKRVINLILSLLAFGSVLVPWSSALAFFVWAGLLIVATLLLNLGVLAKSHAPGGLQRLLLSPLMLVGILGISLAISGAWVRLIVVAAGAALFYFYQNHFPEELPKNGEETAVLGTAALLFGFLWSVNFYFTPPWYGTLLLAFVLFFLIFLYTSGLEHGLIGALIVVEVTWALLYWPTHFLTTTAVGFTAFYLMYVVQRLIAVRRLTRKQIYFQAGAVGLLLLIVLISSPWRA